MVLLEWRGGRRALLSMPIGFVEEDMAEMRTGSEMERTEGGWRSVGGVAEGRGRGDGEVESAAESSVEEASEGESGGAGRSVGGDMMCGFRGAYTVGMGGGGEDEYVSVFVQEIV